MATAREIVIALALRFEGLRLAPYLCPAGVPTIGGGSTHYEDGTPVRMSDPPISRERAMALMGRDVDAFLVAGCRLSPGLLREVARKAAIVDFIYNMGPGRYRASTLRRKVAEGNWPDAAEQLGKWVWGGGHRLKGLVRRRVAEAALIR